MGHNFKLPDGKILVPEVVSQCSDFVEYLELMAERPVRFARLVGRENVIAGSDCGWPESESSQDRLGQVRSHSRGRSAGQQRTMEGIEKISV